MPQPMPPSSRRPPPLSVHPLDAQALLAHAAVLDLPMWAPWPLPAGWLVTGHGHVGDATSARATVFVSGGPNPLGGDADMIVVAEEPGTGLGSWFAGLETPDPGPGFHAGSPHAKATVGGHPTSLWCVHTAASDRAAYAGEAAGRWLWVVLHPESAGALMMEELVFADVRDLGREVELFAYGERSGWLEEH
jgi:hypothetical protein